MANLSWQPSAQHQMRLAEIAIRGAATMFDLQLQTARDIMGMQAKTASILGIPDYSPLFETADDRARRLFTEGADRLVDTTRRASETVAEVNRHIGRLVEQQTVTLAETMREGIDQLARHTEQGLEQARTVVERGADELSRSVRQSQAAVQSVAQSQPGKSSEAERKK